MPAAAKSKRETGEKPSRPSTTSIKKDVNHTHPILKRKDQKQGCDSDLQKGKEAKAKASSSSRSSISNDTQLQRYQYGTLDT